MPAIDGGGEILSRTSVLIQAAAKLGVRTLLTEQYPKGLGRTVPAVAELLPGIVAEEKMRFSALTPGIREILDQQQIDSVLVCGVESHVCILQTCLDLCDAGWFAFLAADACGSRRPIDHQTALRRMEQAGVVLTTAESAILEWVEEAGTDRFKSVLPLIK